MRSALTPRRDRDGGFTLIELLVVIIIIGILAAIAIPVFLRQRTKAVDASLKSDLRSIAGQLEAYGTDGGSSYPAANAVTQSGPGADVVFAGTNFRVSAGNVLLYTVTTNTFCLQAKNAKASDPANGYFWDSVKGGLQPAGTTSCS